MSDQNHIQELVALAENRSRTYTLLSRVWGKEIDQALLQELQAARFPSLPQLPGVDQAYRRLEKSLQGLTSASLTDLAVDYARLCLGSDPSQGADPYESVHRNKEGLLMQDEWEAVLNLYAELGLERAEHTHESEDHLALELEAMAVLCTRQAQALESGQFQEASFWMEQQIRMLDQHLLQWTPSFVQRVEAMGQTEFYKAFGDLTLAYLRMDLDLLREDPAA